MSKFKDFSSVREFIDFEIVKLKGKGFNPNTIVLSKQVASVLAGELYPYEEYKKLYAWRDLVGLKYSDMDIIIVNNPDLLYVQILEIVNE